MAKIIISNLSKNFGNKTILKNISFEVEKGEFFAYIGPNGSGKTTTIRIILGVLTPTKGKVCILDDNSFLIPKNKIGFVLEKEEPFEDFTPLEYLKFYGEMYDVKYCDEKIENLLKELNLYDKKKDKISTLSKGMKRKLCIAKSLINDPEVLILDEPFEGIEIEARREIKNILYEKIKEKKIIFITSHNLYEIEPICTSFGILINGELKGKWKKEDLKNKNMSLEDFYFKIKGEECEKID